MGQTRVDLARYHDLAASTKTPGEGIGFVNTAHPVCLRAVASRSEGYHAALSVGMALAAVVVEPAAAASREVPGAGRRGDRAGPGHGIILSTVR